jgi:adenine-specific DNA-methyltransferase
MRGFFEFAKPPQLITRLLTWVEDPDAVVLDFFAGSGTTAQAVFEQNAADGGHRRFIMVQLDEELDANSLAAKKGYATIAEVSRERIRRAGKKIIGESGLTADGLDVGFRALKVDTTNMAGVLLRPDETDQAQLAGLEDSVKPDRSGEDLLFQVLLDWGLELTMPISVEQVEGHEVFVVENDALIACFDTEVSTELVSAIAKRAPLRAVFRDSGFASDDARINAEQILREISPTTDVKAL